MSPWIENGRDAAAHEVQFDFTRLSRYAHCNLGREKIEVAAAVRLLHRVEKQLAITARVELARIRWAPLPAPCRKLIFLDKQLETAPRDIQLYAVTVLNERERPARRRFRRHVQHDGAESRAAQ